MSAVQRCLREWPVEDGSGQVAWPRRGGAKWPCNSNYRRLEVVFTEGMHVISCGSGAPTQTRTEVERVSLGVLHSELSYITASGRQNVLPVQSHVTALEYILRIYPGCDIRERDKEYEYKTPITKLAP